MRRWLIWSAAVALGLFLAGAGLLLWAVTTPGLLNTERLTDDPAKVAAIAASDLGIAALPAGVAPLAVREDGFQERIVWIRLDATDEGLAALLAALETSPEALDLSPLKGAPVFESFAGFEEWQAPEAPGRSGTTTLPSPRLAHLRLTVIENGARPGFWHLYLSGHET